MPYFYNGRLWISPATMSRIDDTAMANRNLRVGNVLAVLGTSEGGQPNTPLRFGDPSQAIATLRSGALLDAVLAAFNPSNETNGPSLVIAMRVNPAVQGALNLLDGSSGQVIQLKTTDYGLYTNQAKIKVEAGSVSGKKVTTQLGSAYFVGDNLERAVLTVRYSGAQASATLTIDNNTATLQAPTGTTVATIDLATYNTVQKLADRINSVASFTATVTAGQADTATLAALDTITAVNVKTADYLVKADLQAVIDWINGQSEGFFTAVRPAGAGAVPANIPFTYVSGGTDGSTTNTEWTNAFTVLQSEDVQWIVPATSDASIHAMADAHCQFMSSVGRKERRAICGTALSTTDSAAIALAKALNSDRTSLVHLGHYEYSLAGVLTLYAPFITAARIAGGFAGVNPGTPLTNKAIVARGLERKLRNPTDTDVLITGGVLCLEDTPQGFKVVKSISTWLQNLNYNRVEVSCGVAADFVARNVREAVDVLRGAKGTPQALQRAVGLAESTLRELARPEPAGPGVIVGDAENPAYRNIRARLEGDVLAVEFECSPVIPINYIPVTISIVPYSGTASA